MNLIKKLLFLFSRREKERGLILFAMMLISAGLETLGIGIVMPFLGLISDPSIIQRKKALLWIYERLHMHSSQDFIVFCGLSLVAVYIFKNLYMVALIYFQNRFVFNKETALSRQILSAYLHQPYDFHLQKNSAMLITNLTALGKIFDGVLVPLLTVFVEFLVLASIMVLLFWVDPLPAFCAIFVLGTATYAFYRAIRDRVRMSGIWRQHYNTEALKQMNQALGGIKETIVLGRADFFVDAYTQNVRGYADATRFTTMAGQFPRLFIEVIAIAGIVLLVCITIWRGKSPTEILPTLGLFGLAAVRLLPSLNRIVSSLAVIRFSKPSVDIAYNDLKEFEVLSSAHAASPPAPSADPIRLKHSIELRDLGYRYPNAATPALSHVSLKIARGASVAFIGPSGAGKTTLADLILGLFQPTSGEILVDGQDISGRIQSWQRSLGYIPQSIYLSDDSVRGNVAFGVSEERINDEQVWKALRAAQMEDFVKSLPEGLGTFVGERGVRLSGGQRQRIGIARALYHDPEVLVLDEATSALDSETEREVTRAIDSLSGVKTLIVIAHRLSTAEKCGQIFKLVQGSVVASGSYQEVCGGPTL